MRAHTRRRTAARSRARVAGALSVTAALALSAAAMPTPAHGVTPSPWRDFTNLSPGEVSATFPPELEAAQDGSALAVWVRGTGDDAVVRAAAREFRGPWAPPQDLSSEALARAPDAALDDNGDAAVAWIDGPAGTLRARVRPGNTGAWLPAEAVPGAEPVAGADVALTPRGDVVAAWRDLSTGVVRAAVRSAATGAWGAPVAVSSAGQDGPVELAAGADGTVMAQWGAGEGPKHTAVRLPAGGWEAPETLPDGGVLAAVHIALEADGDAVALELGGTGRDSFAQVADRPQGGSWSAFTRVSRPGGTGVSDGAVAVDGAGRALATWLRREGGRGIVQMAARAADGTWAQGRDVSPAEADVASPALALAGDGTATVLWRSTLPEGHAVRARRRAPDGELGPVEPVAAPDGGIAPTLVAAAGREGATAAWERGGFLQSADRQAGPTGDVRLSERQLLINQRISQAAVRRINAVRATIAGGLGPERIRPGALPRERFGAGVDVSGTATGAVVPPGPPAPVPVAGPGAREPGAVRLAAAQLLINQRISQAAVLRANAIAEALDAGLTGGDVSDGSVNDRHPAPGLSVRATSAVTPQLPSDLRPAEREPGGGGVSLSATQLLINQRISQAAVLRANALLQRLERGLPGSAFRDGAITALDLAPRPG